MEQMNRTTENSSTSSLTEEYVPAHAERSGAKSKGAESRHYACFDFTLQATLSMSGTGGPCNHVAWSD